ncbi:MAG: heme exporter protein CcmD [Pseudomonadota bacterium]|nr:heme exporter protein CcmD [Pseudomonadota bacterium]
MNFIYEFFSMGGFSVFVWPAYMVAFLVLVVFLIASIRQHRLSEKKFLKAKKNLPEPGSKGSAPLP